MPLNVGLVGFGYSAKVLHLPLIRAAGLRVLGVVSRRSEAVRALLPEARVVPDLDALLALPALDLVVIATPNDLHEAQGLAALAAGKRVLIDKPMALDAAGAGRLVEAASRRPGALSVFHNRRWDGDLLTVRRLLAEGALGTLHTCEARWDRWRPLVRDRWRERAAQGGGLLLDLGSHLIDQALLLFGTPEWLQADLWCQRSGATVEDAFEIRMGKGPLRVVLSASCLVAQPGDRFRLHGDRGSFCKRGLDVQEQQLKDGLSPLDPAFGVEPEAQRGLLTGESPAPVPVATERGDWLHFYQRLAGAGATGAPPVTASEALAVLRLIEAARESSRTGRRIALPAAPAASGGAARR